MVKYPTISGPFDPARLLMPVTTVEPPAVEPPGGGVIVIHDAIVDEGTFLLARSDNGEAPEGEVLEVTFEHALAAIAAAVSAITASFRPLKP